MSNQIAGMKHKFFFIFFLSFFGASLSYAYAEIMLNLEEFESFTFMGEDAMDESAFIHHTFDIDFPKGKGPSLAGILEKQTSDQQLNIFGYSKLILPGYSVHSRPLFLLFHSFLFYDR